MWIEKLFFTNTIALFPLVIALVLFDNFVSIKSKLSELQQACIRMLCYFILTIIFGYGIFYYQGSEKAGLFVAGYILEYSLSIDNLFLFLIIIKFFDIKDQANRLLTYGIIITTFLRIIFIQIGVVAIEKFHFTLAIFGIILLIGAVKMLFHNNHNNEEHIANSFLYKKIKRFIPIDNSPTPSTLFVIQNKKIKATKLFLAMICVIISDIICSFDSIPAIFGITKDIFIIYSSNIFAIIGLRSAYIVIMPIIEKFKFLEKIIFVILIIIAIKLIVSPFI